MLQWYTWYATVVYMVCYSGIQGIPQRYTVVIRRIAFYGFRNGQLINQSNDRMGRQIRGTENQPELIAAISFRIC